MIAPHLESLMIQAQAMDRQNVARAEMLDRTFDLHNDLTDWATDTEHGGAALEVMAILEKYASPRLKIQSAQELQTVASPEALSPKTAG